MFNDESLASSTTRFHTQYQSNLNQENLREVFVVAYSAESDQSKLTRTRNFKGNQNPINIKTGTESNSDEN